jgi:adenosine deaminase
VQIVLGDDNPIQTGSDLVEERQVLVDRLSWNKDDLADLDRVSADAVFAEPSVGARLRARLDA